MKANFFPPLDFLVNVTLIELISGTRHKIERVGLRNNRDFRPTNKSYKQRKRTKRKALKKCQREKKRKTNFVCKQLPTRLTRKRLFYDLHV